MQFIFMILIFNILLFSFVISSFAANVNTNINNNNNNNNNNELRKCKYYSSDDADENVDPECGKDSTFCFSLWRIASTSPDSNSNQQSHSHDEKKKMINNDLHSSISNSNNRNSLSSIGSSNSNKIVNEDYHYDNEDDDRSKSNSRFINSTLATAAASSKSNKIEFIKQGCWEASPKSSCDKRNCTSIIKKDPSNNGGNNYAPNQQFFCCCTGDYCNEMVQLIEKGEYGEDNDNDMDDYFDELDSRSRSELEYGHDSHDKHSSMNSQQHNRWMFIILILMASILGITFLFSVIFCWIKSKHTIKTKDEEMVEVEQKLIDGGGINGINGIIVKDGNDDGKGWQLSQDETIVLGNEIAKGKYATVFNAKVGGRSVAMKIFANEHKEVYKNERWILECLSKFNSNKIIKYHGWQEMSGVNGPELMIVLDRISPGSLRDFLCAEQLNLTFEQCLKIVCGIVEGISVLHGGNSEGVVIAHRDLTSKNVLIDSELNTYIADFGLSLKTQGSKYRFGGNGAGCIERQAETSNLCEAGTLRYMAPELLEGAVNLKDCENSLKQIDIYSVAIIIWEVVNLCGDLVLNVGHKLPFHELGKEITMESLTHAVVLRRQRPTFSNWRDHIISRQLRETIVDSWDPEPEARLTCLCVFERLHDLLSMITNPSLIAGLKSSEEPLESNNCLNEDEIWISRNPNLERNLLFGKSGDDSGSSTQYLVTMSEKHRPPNSNSLNTTASMNNNNNNPNNNHQNLLHNSHNNSNLLHHHHNNGGHNHHRLHQPNTEQSISTGNESMQSMTTMNTELSSASLTNFVQNVL